ncbi:MAG: hypothetical protein M1609_16240 [Firmicutes bacterium]|nr:hypothetical protein [Bacillota bacterium]MCL5056798.1 hypothetical protein [Actinomycetota bacterium]
MKNLKKGLSLLICAVFILSLLAGPALAKGGKSFSGGGRSSFSSGAKGFSSGGSFSTSPKSTSGISGGGSTSGKSTGSVPESTAGGGTGSFGKGYSTETDSFSTPRQGTPPALSSDYSTGKQGYSTGSKSYSTGTGSYAGSWNRDSYASSGADKYPSKPPVGVFGSPPQPPYYYHNNYWSMPLLSRMFFQPNYYWTPWGYHFFAPRLLTWIIAIFLIGAVFIFIKNRIRGSTH